MAKTSTTFIRGRMNKSVDERLVPPGEYVDAVNVRLGSTETTEIGAVENSKGNSLIAEIKYQNLPLSDNARTIGCFEDGMNETLYWFIHDDNNSNSSTNVVDMIVSFNTNTNAIVYHVVSVSVLNFSFKYLITGVSKIENLLFFTDDLNPPRFINVTRDYELPQSGLDVLEEEDISVIVKPPGFEDYDASTQLAPLGTPHVELIKLPGTDEEDENYMKTRFLSFAYRYRYADGQYSATSLFSEPAFEPGQFEFSLQNYWNEGMANEYNACNVTFSTGSKRVKEVQVLYKDSSSNVIYVIQRFVKSDEGWPDNDFKTITFSNSEIYTTLGSDELLRLYDNVPHTAKAQTIQGNRLMYGNYVDGYNVTAVEGGPDIFIDYKAQAESSVFTGISLGNYDSNAGPLNPVLSSGDYTIQASVPGPPATVTQADSKITWDLSEVLPANGIIPIGTTLNFQFSIQQTTDTYWTDFTTWSNSSQLELTNQNAGLPFSISMTFTSTQPYNSVNDLLNSQEFKNKIGGAINTPGFNAPYIIQSIYPCNNTTSGATLTDKFYATVDTLTDPMLYPVSFLDILFPAYIGTPPFVYNWLNEFWKFATGGISNSCSNTTLFNSSPWPGTCSTQILSTGLTDPTSIISGQLTCTTVNFNADGVSVGNIVVVTNSASGNGVGLQAQVTAVINNNELLIQDINTPGATSVLEILGTSFQITNGGNTPQACPPQAFDYSVSGSTFTLQLPATQFWIDVDVLGITTQPIIEQMAFRYYNFVQYDCTLTLEKNVSPKSLHSNRDYEVGIVYMDEYGRASTVLTSGLNTVFFDPDTSEFKNRIKVTLNNLPPYWAKKYKFVVKPSAGDYETIFCNTFYKQDGSATSSVVLPVAEIQDESLVWFKLEGQNSNIIKVGDELIVKQDTEGPTPNQQKAVVLALQSFPSKGITDVSLSGLYMQLKPEGWSVDSPNKNYFYGTYKKDNDDPSAWWHLCIHDYPLNQANGTPYNIPQGSIITIKIRSYRKGKGDCVKSIKYHRTFRATDNYADFYEWAIGDDLESKMQTNSEGVSDKNGMTIAFIPTLGTYPYNSGDCFSMSPSNFNVRAQIIRDPNTGALYFAVNGALDRCDGGWFDKNKNAKLRVTIEVTRTPGIIIFETIPSDVSDDLFYDASELLDIEPEVPGGQAYHKAKRNFSPSPPSYTLAALSQDQSATQPLITLLDASNCYSFGNGVESYRIYDSPVGKPFKLGERVLAVSNQDFKEADRFASITYSGVYRSSANVNNLNEFNLGLVNFKDCETAFGPIQVLHARETDVLTLQEDRITYVQNGKNLLSDAVGGGAVVSTPVVLGEQIARIEEYGISFNPESFVSWGSDMYFTDAKRGAVLNLRGSGKGLDSLHVISKLGMNSWFRDTFNQQLTTQKLGGYDPYMKEFVLGTNLNTVPVPIDVIPCGQSVAHNNSSEPLTYIVNLGDVIETITIDYSVTSGSIDISIVWDNPAVPSASVSGATVPGTLTFNKTTTTPNTCTVTVTPNVSSSYSVNVGCPPENEITVRQIVLNSSDYEGQTTHIGYKWNDGTYFSPTPLTQVTLTSEYNQPASIEDNTGVRSIGMFPYDNTNITLRCEQLVTDTFNFIPANASTNPNAHKLRILSSNTDYSTNNYNAAEIAAMVGASTWAAPVVSTQSNTVHEASLTNFSIPAGNQYLYLIWDFRLVTTQIVCKCATTDPIYDLCCNCTLSCKTVLLGPVAATQAAVCVTDVDSPQKGSTNRFSFLGNASIPSVGDVVYDSLTCSRPFKAQGFYIASPVSPSVLPKRWIQINNAGVVVNEGIC